MVDAVLKELSAPFDRLYSDTGRPSIAPEKLLRALLLQVLYTVRSERLLMEQLNYNLLFRWFVGLNLDDPLWDPSTFSKNRERLLEGDVAHAFFDQVWTQAREHDLLSDEHCTVDGTLMEAWAGQKSFQRKLTEPPPLPPDDAGNPSIDFRGERRTNATHASTTDPEARLYKKAKGQEAQLSYLGHVLMENRHGLVVDTCVTQATGPPSARPRSRWSKRFPVDIGSPRELTKTTTPVTLSASGGSCGGHHMSPSIRQADPVPWMGAQRTTQATPSVSGNGNRSKKSLDG
jgi:transposase